MVPLQAQNELELYKHSVKLQELVNCLKIPDKRNLGTASLTSVKVVDNGALPSLKREGNSFKDSTMFSTSRMRLRGTGTNWLQPLSKQSR